MGSFFLTSKKASATLIFLVISILVVSSGVIITNQIKKSNDDNIKGTGLVLLDTEQDNSQYSDSSDDRTKLFTFGDSGGKSSSKKSSGGGGGGSDLDSQTYNEPEILDNDEIVDDQTSENQTEMNYTEGINESELEDDFINSSREIFSRNGTTYIMRDGGEYVLSISSSTYYIEFYPSLPSSVCENERIDITVRGKAEVKYPSDCGAWIRIRIMEDDYLIEDETVADYSSWYFSTDCKNVYFKHTFENVDLSDWIIPDPGGNGEFYAKASGSGIVNDLSTPSYDVYAYRNGEPDECDCLSGACCDLSSRPYEFKPYPSQPTGYTDYYYCSGTNSPTGTSSCIIKDYYCDGDDSAMHFYTGGVDTCGICEYCTYGDPTCNYYSSSYSCGTKDCDYLDTTCRNYNDVSKYCSSGSCISPSCTSYTNTPKHTSCGTNNECDGSGICITCTSHSYTGCWYDDVYYYDACDNREEKKLPDCGISACSDWYRDTCHGNDAYETQLCYNKGCTTTAPLGVHCYSNSYENERFVETCQYGCLNGNCKPNPNIACYSNSDCGTDGLIGDPYCSNDDVYWWEREYTCNYPGTEQSFCSSEDDLLIQNCGEDFYSSDYCYDDDVYQNFTDRGCSGRLCFENTTAQFIYECGEEGCSDGECLYVECYNHTMCDPDNDPDNNYVGDPWCSNDDVWQNYINYTCNYAGAGNSFCSNSTAPDLKEPCGSDYCESWGSGYCKLDDLYHERTCYDKGCSGAACFDNTYIEEEKVEECGISEYTGNSYCYNEDIYRDYITRGCTYSRCTSSTSEKKTEDCEYGCTSERCKIEVCSYGGCYYY